MSTSKSKRLEQHGLSRSQLNELLADLAAYAGRIRGFRKVKRKVEDNGIIHISGEIILLGLGDFRFMIIPFLKHEKFWTIHLEDAHQSLESGNTVYTAYHFPHLSRNPELKKRVAVANWVIGQLTNNTGFSLPGKTVAEMRQELDFLGVPAALRSRERVLDAVRLIREANLPKASNPKFEKN